MTANDGRDEETSNQAGGEPLRLTDCTVGNIEALHAELVSRQWGSGAVSIDRGAVARPNTAMLQLIAAFVRDLKAQSRSVQWCGESTAFDRCARALGLSAVLGLPPSE
jgi:STAS domain